MARTAMTQSIQWHVVQWHNLYNGTYCNDTIYTMARTAMTQSIQWHVLQWHNLYNGTYCNDTIYVLQARFCMQQKPKNFKSKFNRWLLILAVYFLGISVCLPYTLYWLIIAAETYNSTQFQPLQWHELLLYNTW